MRLGLVLALLLGTATADARNATGYVGGAKTTVKLTDVNGKDVEVRTAKAFRVMAKAARKKGVTLSIRSGFRSYAKQAKLYKQYRRGEGNLAAPPGYSNHESGRALDLYVTDHKAFDWLQEHARTYGFHRTVPGEAWHWEYLGDEDKDAIARPERKTKRKKPKQTS
jgi:LAS superfamily LD-carboxypeptidase LdcB